jgi:hypothetical protein
MTFKPSVASDFMKLARIPDDKRPSLVNFTDNDFLSLKNSLIKYAKAVYPLDYQYFVESDLGMMFIELVAYMGATLSMKADMLANENFLVTARNRSSVKKLLQLIGVRLRGPLSAAADAQLEADTTVSTRLLIPASSRTINSASPEDGGATSYTLYKIVNGVADLAPDGLIALYPSEANNAGATVFKNLVLQEGALVTDSGDFAATEAIKTIKLTRGPVVEGSVQVKITSTNSKVDGEYKEVDNIFFASGVSDRIFEVVYDDSFNATLVFGDGTVGISPDDSASYFIQYRVGGGTRGNMAKNAVNPSISIAIDDTTYDNKATLTNTSRATGGSNAETVEHAKKYAPLTFRRQDRIVTLEDYSVFSNTFISTFGTVGKATAVTRDAYSSANTIDIYVLEKASDFQLQQATPNFKTQLLSKINEKKMATDEIVIVDGLIRTLDLVTTIRIDREHKQNENQIISSVRNKILTYMNVDNRSFGQPLEISELNREIFEVEEVRYSTLDNLGQDVLVDFNEIIQLNNLTIKVAYLD